MKKKIVFIISTFFSFGGEQRVLASIANELLDLYDITIISCDNENQCKCPFDINPKIKFSFINPRTFFERCCSFLLRHLPISERFRQSEFYLRHTVFFPRLVKQLSLKVIDFDYVIPLAGFFSIICGMIKEKHPNLNVIGWQHNSFEAYFRNPGRYCWNWDNIFKKYVSKLNHCIVLNEDYSQKYKQYFNIDCDVIYNPRSFVSDNKSKCVNKRFIVCARLTMAKGIDILLKAFKIFAQNDDEWILDIVGDGEMRKELDGLIVELGLTNRVNILGFRKDVRELMIESSIYLLPSRWEGFPMVLTEACEIGLPSIVFDIPAVLPFSSKGTCIVCESFDVTKYAKAMMSLASDYELRLSMSNNSIKMAESLAINNIMKKWKTILE